MTKKEKHLLLFKSFFLLAICVCLTIGLYTQTVKGTTAYVTSLSVTCVNTFTGESQTEPSQPTEPSESEPMFLPNLQQEITTRLDGILLLCCLELLG